MSSWHYAANSVALFPAYLCLIVPQDTSITVLDEETMTAAGSNNSGAKQAERPENQHNIAAASTQTADDASAGGTVSTEQLAYGSAGDLQQQSDSGVRTEAQAMNLM